MGLLGLGLFLFTAIVYGSSVIYENHATLAASPVENLPAGYLKASSGFLKNYDSLVARQNKLQEDIKEFQSRIPNGYAFDYQFRAFKPTPPPAAPSPAKPPQ